MCAALLVGSALFGRVSRADDEDPRAAAAADYARGLELANQGRYGGPASASFDFWIDDLYFGQK